MNNRIETAAKVLVALFVLASLASIVMLTGFPFTSAIVHRVPTIIMLIVRLAIAYWLYIHAKPESKYPWVWCLLGLTFALIAVAAYFMIDMHEKLCHAQDEKEQT